MSKGSPRIHALAIYLKGFEAISYEQLRGLFPDAFGLDVSDGAPMNMFIGCHSRFIREAKKAKAIFHAARVVASAETGVRIEGTNADSDEAGHAFQYEAGHRFRSEAGRRTDLKPATQRSLPWIAAIRIRRCG